MIDLISMGEIRQLAEAHSPSCVSLYLPTPWTGDAELQNPIRYKNVLARARAELEAGGSSAARIDVLLSEAASLHDDAEFWAHTAAGLAVFVDDDEMSTYRLPDPVDELAVVAERFHLTPLLPSVSSHNVFYVLALSRHHVRLLRGSRVTVDQVALGAIPESLAHALRFDDRERQLQSHAMSRTGTGRVIASFHGQGAAKDKATVDLDRFLAAVDRGFREIAGDSGAPLVLAGVGSVVAHHRKVSKYRHIVEGDVEGNPDHLRPQEIHDRAWPLVEPVLHARQQAARSAIESGSAPTLTSLTGAVAAAHDGRVESLFVPIAHQRWGSVDDEFRCARAHDRREPGDIDLVEVAAISTLTHGGGVFAVPESDIPGGAAIAAALRY